MRLIVLLLVALLVLTSGCINAGDGDNAGSGDDRVIDPENPLGDMQDAGDDTQDSPAPPSMPDI